MLIHKLSSHEKSLVNDAALQQVDGLKWKRASVKKEDGIKN